MPDAPHHYDQWEALAGGLFVGGTPSRGLVLGGAVMTQYFQYRISPDVASIGPFIAYYPNPHVGANVQAMLGVAYAADKSGHVFDERARTGVSLMVSSGYDFRITNQWALGPSFCVSAFTTKQVMEDAAASTFAVVSIAVALSVTYY